MGNLQIKDMPEELHAGLRLRAAARGISQRDFVLGLIRRELAMPTWDEWESMRTQREHTELSVPAADIIRAGREEREAG